jgi:S1-C subfamily serine protease
MPSRRDFLTGIGGALGGSVITGGSVFALTSSDSDSTSNRPHTRTPEPTTSTVHTTTPDPTTTHTPTTTTATPTTTTTTTSKTTTATTTTTTTSTTESCDSQEFDCDVVSKAQDVGLNVRPSVVFLDVDLGNHAYSSATGWFVDENGHIVTNQHVIEGYQEITVYTLDGSEYAASVKGSSEQPDAALLQIDENSTPALPIGDPATVADEQPLVEVGHPSNVGNWVINLGRYLGLRKYKNEPNDHKTSIPTAKGSSGAATLTLDGEVVSLNYGGAPTDPWIPGEKPDVYKDDVQEELNRNMVSVHEPITEVMSKVDAWK